VALKLLFAVLIDIEVVVHLAGVVPEIFLKHLGKGFNVLGVVRSILIKAKDVCNTLY
jgi:hypothetical protein